MLRTLKKIDPHIEEMARQYLWETFGRGGNVVEGLDELAKLLQAQQDELVGKFEKALAGIERTMPEGYAIVSDPDGNYALENWKDTK